LKYDQPSDIPDSVIEDIKTKKTYTRIARGRANKLGFELDELPDDEWRDIWWKRAKRRSNYYRKTKLEHTQEEHREVTAIVEEQPSVDLSKYLEYYADPAPNDLLALRQLISMERQLAQVDKLIDDVLNPDDDGDINTSRYKNLVSVQKQLSTEMRLLQDSLGISRKIRDQRRSESELADHLKANIAQARELITEIGTKLYCPHCRAEEGTAILHGFLIDHFPETGMTVSKRCPSCGRDYTIEVPPRKWERQLGQILSLPSPA
jgi:hypothetical protein